MSLTLITANLLDIDAQYIVHQTNCQSSTAQGLAAKIFLKYPYSNVYHPSFQRKPGEIMIMGNGLNQRYVINLFGQYYPGKPGGNGNDTAKARETFFQQGLDKIAQLPNLRSIAFPHYIGCGLAGGDWKKYFSMLEQFASKVKQEQGTKVMVCKLEKQEFQPKTISNT